MTLFMLKKNFILKTFFRFHNYQDNMTSEKHTLPIKTTSSSKRPTLYLELIWFILTL